MKYQLLASTALLGAACLGSAPAAATPQGSTSAPAPSFSGLANAQGPLSSLRSIQGRQVWVPICGRLGANGTDSTIDATSTYSMDQTGCYAPSWGTVSAIELVYAGFDMPQNGESDRSITGTLTASAFAPGNHNFTAPLAASVSSGASTITVTPSYTGSTNAVSVGQRVAFTGGYALTYITSVTNTVNSADLVTGISLGLNTPTTGTATAGETITFVGQTVQATFGGAHSLTVLPRHGLYYSDPIPMTLTPNQVFFVRTYAALSGAGLQLQASPNTAAGAITSGIYSEFDQRGTSGVTDLTLSPFNATDAGGHFGPVEVLALVTPTAGTSTPGAAIVFGDSLTAGAGDDADSKGNVGYVERSMNNSIPYVNMGRGSTTLAEALAQSEGQHALSLDAGITDVLDLLGRNDLEAYSVSAATLEAELATFNARYTNEGKRVWCVTYPPYTASNDGWATLGDQGWIQETDTTSGVATAAGSPTITLTAAPTTNIVGALVSLTTQDGIYTGSAGAAVGASTIPMLSTVSPTSGYIWGPFVPDGTQYTASGSTITLSNGATLTSALAPYQEINLDNGIFGGTTVSSVSGSVVTLSHVTTGVAIPASSSIIFSVQTANAVETQRLALNTYVRSTTGQTALNCLGRVIDVEALWADQGGSHKWRVDLGGSTFEGIHPAPQIHIFSYNQGVIPISRFTPN